METIPAHLIEPPGDARLGIKVAGKAAAAQAIVAQPRWTVDDDDDDT